MAQPPGITGVDFVHVWTKNFDQAVSFYENVLGLPVSRRYNRIPGGEFDVGNLTLVVFDCGSVGIEFRPNPHAIALHVDDFDDAYKRLQESGVRFNDTIDSGVCKMAVFQDPDGNTLMLHHRYAGEDEEW